MPDVDVIVIGGGVAGLMAAGIAAGRGNSVTVIEKNGRPARKLMITGKGRCNLTNNCGLDELIKSTPSNGRFLYSAFSKFLPADTIDFFEGLGLPLKTERGKRVFPQSDKAVDVVDTLVNFARKSGAKINVGTASNLIIADGEICGVELEGSRKLNCKNVIVATGGVSYPITGSTGDGYEFAKQAGHTIIEPSPSLVPLEIEESFCNTLMGLSLKNSGLSIIDTQTNKTVYTDFGEMLFTHFGVSGPMILSASAHLRDMSPLRYKILIDLKPALSNEQLDKRIQRDFIEHQNKNLDNALVDLLPQKLIPIIISVANLTADIKINQLTKEQRTALVTSLKALPLSVTGFRPIEEAVVTRGGVCVKEVDPKTMQSRLVKGLYFTGEVLDVDAYTGGFNLQIAFSTGHLAGENV